jgi:type IV secretory pathway VirB2 component (pilin)
MTIQKAHKWGNDSGFGFARFSEAVRSWPQACFNIAQRMDKNRVAAFALVGLSLTVTIHPAFAQSANGGGDITTFLQNLVNIITGTAGKLISVLAICIVGIGAMLGALSMRAAGGTILGVMLVFSASWIVNQIVGQ